MGLFIEVAIEEAACASQPECRECVQSCPVDILERAAGERVARVIDENVDECILCDLCVVRCPVEAVTVTKLYAAG
ncbi:MAG: 4Fe-4S dicluster domain-containing protein [Dehalococcoidia bacterium]|nr:4Fe-4S dicluster domain-containing protein [Dehalococcoidia bacterium]MYA53116.1 4Fe-4S dicluster domain-containing protein [Dehalococcoidia bacterium]